MEDLSRYDRLVKLDSVGEGGVRRLKNATVTIVGLGGLGSVVAQLLARAGVGRLILIDRDYVEEENLHRQILYNEEDVGQQKAYSAMVALNKINSDIDIESHFENLDYTNISRLVKGSVIVDCTDNLETRFLINEYAKKNNIPWIYGGAVTTKGFVWVIQPFNICFRCVFSESKKGKSCSEVGVHSAIVSIVGTLQASEAFKLITGQPVEKNLLHFNLADNTLTKIRVKKSHHCPVCTGVYDRLEGRHVSGLVRFCGGKRYMIRADFDLYRLKKQLKKAYEMIDFDSSIIVMDQGSTLTIFDDGRVLIKAENEAEAVSSFSRVFGYEPSETLNTREHFSEGQ